ncbi:hypothetical protein FVF58_43680 [Paraburkholderia panacisoli]|uniref:Uncharacterized protein n=1 Tax=Paraburkholderia panacisoli TaxID=2603818 RepID=A0A5B0G9G8_9BURK|nr:hypothetical protein [Paraburkholderia panacisoli]KAA0998629.1 hypothetical protein FVF58_43680 [Paraburkholderia panacisoli]
MKRQNTPKNWIDIAITVSGVEVTGSYTLDKDEWMTVRMNGGGSKPARGGLAADSVARMILGELYAEANRAKD